MRGPYDGEQTIRPYPRFRHATRDLLEASARKHMIHAMVEIDVTDARRELRRAGQETGQRVSFTAFVIACCARAVDRDRSVHGYRDLRNRLVMFHEADVSTPVERVVGGQNQVVPTIIRRANRRSVREIHRDIEEARTTPVEAAGVFRSIRLYLAIPPLIRRLAFRLLDRFPRLMKKRAGTLMVTSVGMFGSGPGWGIPVASHTLNVTIGGIVRRLRLEEGQPVERDHACLTVSFDHDLVDGAPAARYLRRVRSLMENPGPLLRDG